jgi:hypothetical protein
MATQILEGTIAEIQQQIRILNLKPERRGRLVLDETPENNRESESTLYGVRLFPVTDPNHTMTTEQLLELIDNMEE